ncbi:hypothetical protein ACWERY_32055 [Streptomyces sp. NPDC004082]|uniref:hypothetical protein n=1 Tax=unclassified Streptomyces TaxID=2593676 RepID=UPI00339E00EC
MGEIYSPGTAAFLQYDEHRRAAATHLGVPGGEVRDGSNGTDHRSHTEQTMNVAWPMRPAILWVNLSARHANW